MHETSQLSTSLFTSPNAPSAEAARKNDQAWRMRQLFVHVVFAALDDAVDQHVVGNNGIGDIEHWARSRDGKEVLTCAGIEPGERTIAGLKAFVARGERTSTALAAVNGE